VSGLDSDWNPGRLRYEVSLDRVDQAHALQRQFEPDAAQD
jgi:hypothetical protein